MSGGVDSSAAAIILKKEYETTGVTLSLYSGGSLCEEATKKNIADAKAVCEKLCIEHRTLDYSSCFEKDVIEKFIAGYVSGETPNPCLNCNKYIKFGKMLDYALQNGYDKIASGHYARIAEKNGKFYLKKAADLKKDQTYVLYNLNQQILSRLLLPLGDYTKEQAREISLESGLANAHKSDSQDICFVPDGDYAAFIESRIGKQKEGSYIDKSGAFLGKNKGIIHYTVGQRKGLGIALGKPAFVIKKDVPSNTVTLGSEEDLFYKTVYIKDVNFITEKIADGETVNCKLRYSQKETPCTFFNTESGAKLVFETPQRAPSPGQAAVFYKEDICLGGGIIIKGEN